MTKVSNLWTQWEHRKFGIMLSTYFFGVFNDNYFRQTVLLLAVTTRHKELQGAAILVFTLPFVLFAAWAGWASDRFPRRYVMISSKLFELVAMCLAGVGLLTMNWFFLLATLFLMGFQSSFFGPSMSGMIPQLFEADKVFKANAILRMSNTLAILGGIALGGIILDVPGKWLNIPVGYFATGCIVITFSILGFSLSFGIPKYPAADGHRIFPKSGPLYSIQLLFQTRKDPLLWASIWGKSFFWFLGSLQVMVINSLGVQQFGFSKTMTSGLLVLLLIGMVLGSIGCAKTSGKEKWYSVLLPSMGMITGLLLIVSTTPFFSGGPRNIILVAAFIGLGISGAFFSIPLTAFIQLRAAKHERGSIIAASGFLDFCGILISTPVYNLITALELRPTENFAFMAVLCLLVIPFIHRAFTRNMK